MKRKYGDYVEYYSEDIRETLQHGGCQPILFVGSGLSKRYFGAPNWLELLGEMKKICPKIEKEFAYYVQSLQDPIKIGEVFSELFSEWAWSEGKGNFPEHLFSNEFNKNIYLKHQVSELFKKILPLDTLTLSNGAYGEELALLKNINPHAVVTTNYDQLLEQIFPNYETIIGQKILRKSYLSIGEIFKIHGCVSDPSTLVLTSSDYDLFKSKKQYLSAKLLTYFAEHPLLFIGYSAEDPNIKSILYDIDQMIDGKYDLIPNIYILEWNPEVTDDVFPATEKVIAVNGDRNLRLKSIVANDFSWVFQAFASGEALAKVDTKLLRALMARTHDLVRCNLPKSKIEIDFTTLQHAVESDESFSKLLGLANLSESSQINITHPFTLTAVGIQLGFPNWNGANQLLEKIKEEDEAIDVKASDNKYHVEIRSGNKSSFRKYSQELIDELKKFRNGEQHSISLS
ncbi:MAG: SIR2 family protein [Undibacterium sp.]|uniref:SIR2 family protein n=1 Tax=Undibacterium sp. TaxID=1914977 RepID=UPI0027191168|nr:SIR2 family protein [Undibacterium sp.]MDO8654361.1 SIR2 family protein [Undibacterium sp.]